MREGAARVLPRPMTAWTFVALAALGLSGCRGEPESGAAGHPDGSGRDLAPEAPQRPARRPAVRGLDVSRIDAPQGEDGSGAVVPATDPVALDVLADAWPGRALDPVLHAGTMRFVHYSHPGPGVLRFVAADSSALPEGAEVFVQYGDEQASRMLVTPSLRVPR